MIWYLFACQAGGVLGIGDSILARNKNAESSIPEVVGQELGLKYENKAISGTKLTGGKDAIPEQYISGDWDWVIINGGGNDLHKECDCDESCDPIFAEISSEDGMSGIVPDLVDRITGEGSRVILMGYYFAAKGGEEPTGCGAIIPQLNPKYEQIAASHENVWFVSSGDVITPEDEEYFAEDQIHPSAEGSQSTFIMNERGEIQRSLIFLGLI